MNKDNKSNILKFPIKNKVNNTLQVNSNNTITMYPTDRILSNKVDMGDRLSNIKNSINRINTLMEELKQIKDRRDYDKDDSY